MKSADSKDLVIQVNDINIGHNIRMRREERGIRQADMVRLLQLKGLNVSVYSYNRIEKGTQNPTVSLILEICKILDCDTNLIFGLE